MIFKRSSVDYFCASRSCWLSLMMMLFWGGSLLAQETYLSLIQDKIRNGEILLAQFNHEFTDAYTQEKSQNEGSIWIGWQQYRIETAGQIIVVDGTYSKVLDRSRNRVIISGYDSELDDFAPSKIIGGLANTYQVVDTKKRLNFQEYNLQSSDPFSTFDHSFRTLENALDSSRGKVEHFIYFSSSMVYGNFQEDTVNEDSPCEPLGIYGALKYGGEKLVIAYNQVFELPYTIIRPSALYGERCVSRRVGQIFIENALTTGEITLNGDGLDKLDFTYIGEYQNLYIYYNNNSLSWLDARQLCFTLMFIQLL